MTRQSKIAIRDDAEPSDIVDWSRVALVPLSDLSNIGRFTTWDGADGASRRAVVYREFQSGIGGFGQSVTLGDADAENERPGFFGHEHQGSRTGNFPFDDGSALS